MAATITVPRLVRPRISGARKISAQIIESPIIPRHGVIVLDGYGITVTVDKNHLILRDGVGDERRAGDSPASITASNGLWLSALTAWFRWQRCAGSPIPTTPVF